MSNDYYIHEMEGADFQQQQNIEEFEQYLAELVCGSVSQGIEPVDKNVFVQGSPAGEINRINPGLIERMQAKGKTEKEILDTCLKMYDNNVEEFLLNK